MIINQVGGGGKGYASEAFDINTNTYIYCGESRDVSISSSAYGWRYFPNGSKFSGRLVAADNGEFCIVETEVSSTTNNGKLGNYRQGTVTGSQMNGLLRSVINNSALCDMFRSLHIPSGVPMTIEVYYYAAGSSLFWSEPNPIEKTLVLTYDGDTVDGFPTNVFDETETYTVRTTFEDSTLKVRPAIAIRSINVKYISE